MRKRIVALYGSEDYKGFGPLLFAEKLMSRHEIKVDHETVRRLLIKEGLWQVTRKRKKRHRPWRERRLPVGSCTKQFAFTAAADCLCQLPRYCLMVMIDDATGVRMSLLAEGETTEAAMRLLWMWIERYGVPKSLYTDKKNVFVPSEKDRKNARQEGKEALTQFDRSCKRLGIEIIRAHSPQAKGRVERSNQTYQDRLVKELRLEQISDIDRANELLSDGGFDRDLNRRFAVEAREKADYHRDASGYDLSGIFCIEEERTLSANWTLSFETSVYQIKSGSANYSPASRKVQLRRYLDGSLHMFYRGNDADFEKIDPGKKEKKKFIKGRNVRPLGAGKPSTPATDHPWRKQLLPSRPAPRHP